jgi:ATP-binding cassette subfamily G (WHITE) protein 2 (PDR)
MWVQRPIVEKHSRYAFYRPGIEAIASIIGDFPAKIITSILFNLAIYFLTNLRRTVGAFFTFYMFSVVCLVTMSMFFRMAGSLSRRLPRQWHQLPYSVSITSSTLDLLYRRLICIPG